MTDEPEIVPLPSAPEPVPEEPPGVMDLVARGARLGVDVVGLVAGEIASASTGVSTRRGSVRRSAATTRSMPSSQC